MKTIEYKSSSTLSIPRAMKTNFIIRIHPAEYNVVLANMINLGYAEDKAFNSDRLEKYPNRDLYLTCLRDSSVLILCYGKGTEEYYDSFDSWLTTYNWQKHYGG